MDNLFLIQLIRTIMGIIVFSTMIILFSKRNIKDFKEFEEWNWARTLIIIAIIGNLLNPVSRLIFMLDLAGNSNLYVEDSSIFSLNTISTGIVVLAGLMFAIFINNWKSLQYLPFFFFIGTIWLYLTTGSIELFLNFNTVGGVLALIGIFEVAIRVKDNNSLGLAVFFVLQFVSFIFNTNIVLLFSINFVAYAFGLYYAAGKFKWFKDEEEALTDAQDESYTIPNTIINPIQETA